MDSFINNAFDTFFANSKSIAFLIDSMNLQVIKANQAAVDFYGYTIDELQSMQIPKINMLPINVLSKNISKIVTKEQNQFEFKHKKKNGEIVDVLVNSDPIESDGKTYLFSIIQDISSQKIAEQKLNNEDTLFSQGPVCTIVWEPSSLARIIKASDNVTNVLGYDKDEFLSDEFKYLELIHPDDRNKIVTEVQFNRKHKIDFYEQSYRIKTKYEGYKWFYDFTMLVRNDKSEIEMVRGYIFDQTHIKEIEEKLEQDRQRLDYILKGTNVGTWEWNVQTNETIFNERWANIIGYTLDEISPVSIETWVKYAHPDDLKRSDELLEKHFAGESEFYEFESRMLHKNGKWIWVFDRGKVAEWDAEGKPLWMYGTHQEITQKKEYEAMLEDYSTKLENEIEERKVIEAMLIEREENFRILFDTIDDMLIVANLEGKIIYHNKTVTDKLYYTDDEMINKSVIDLHPNEYKTEAEKILRDVLIHNVSNFSLPLIKKDFSYVQTDCRVWKGKWNNEPCIIGLIKDLTEQQANLDKFRKIFDNNPALLAVSTLINKKITECNNTFLEKLGYTKEEVIGKTADEIELFPDMEDEKKIGELFYKESSIKNLEIKIQTKDKRILEGLFTGDLINNQGELSFLATFVDLTPERKQTEMIEQFFSVGLDLFCIANTEGYFLKLNKAWERTLGYTIEELLSKQFLEYVHPDDLQSILDALSELGSDKEVLNFVNRYRCSNGEYKYLEWRSYPFKNTIYAAARDISERIKSQDELKIRESYLRAIIENQPGLVWLKDKDSNFLAVNRAFAKSCGIDDPELLIGMNDFHIWSQELAENYLNDDIAIMQSMKPRIIEEPIEDNGQVKWFETFKSPVFDDEGRIIGTTGYSHDISERKKVETELIFLSTITSNMNESIVATDSELNITFINSACTQLYGYEFNEIKGRKPDVFEPENSDLKLHVEMNNAIFSGNVYTDIFINQKKDGSRFICEIKVMPMFNQKKDIIGFIGIQRDITDRIQAEEKLKETTERLSLATKAGRIGIWDYDLVSGVLKWDDQMFVLYGRNREDFSGAYSAWVDGLHPDDVQRGDHEIRLALEGKREFDTEFRVIYPDRKTIRNIRAIANVIRDEAGKPIRMIGTNWDITEQKLAEEALQISEARLRESQAIAQIGSWNYDIATNKFVSSGETSSIFETDYIQESTFEEFRNMIYPDDIEFVEEELINTIKTGIKYDIVYRIITGQKKIKYVHAQGRAIYNSDSEPIKVLGTLQDITKLKQAEEALRESEEKYRIMFDDSSDPYLILKDGLVYNCNKAMAAMLKTSIENLIGKSPVEFSPEYQSNNKPTKELAEEKTNYAIVNGSTKFEWIHKKYDNTVFWVDVYLTKMQLMGETLLFASIRDITDRKRAQEKIAQLMEQFELAIEGSNDGIWDWNVKTNEVFYSSKWKEMIGYRDDELENNFDSFDHNIHPDDREHVMTVLNNYFEQKIDSYSVEFRFRHKLGHYIWILARGKALRDENGKPYRMAGSHSDITERKSAEEKLNNFARDIEWANWELTNEVENRKATEQLLKEAVEEAKKANRAKSEFLANMSHEIRTPMNSILGFSEIMLNSVNDNKHKGYLETILNSGKTLLSLINDILDLSKIEAGRLQINNEDFCLKSVVEDIGRLFEQKLQQKGLELYIEIDSEFPNTLYFDELKIRQILLNLVGNAVKFTNKGYIKVVVKCDKIDIEKIDFSISVIDTGIGINKSEQELIFESFRQQSGQDSRHYGGTGLGLAITKRLCELMGGLIKLDSEPGHGSAFTILFTNVNYSNTILNTQSDYQWMDNTKFDKSILLVVDDIEMNRKLVVSYLENYEIEVIEAESGEESIEKASYYNPDIILMDIRMPVMNGYTATEIIKSKPKLSRIPIIAFTASVMSSDQAKLDDLFDGYLSKPVQKFELIQELKKYLQNYEEKKENVTQQVNDINITKKEIPKEKWNEIVAEFQKEFSNEIDDVILMMNPESINICIKKLKCFGDKYKLFILEDYCKKLDSHLENFDFDKIEMLLSLIKKGFSEE